MMPEQTPFHRALRALAALVIRGSAPAPAPGAVRHAAGRAAALAGLLFLVLAPAAFGAASDPEARRAGSGAAADGYLGPGPRGPYVARRGMVATADRHATRAALRTLRAGGNAADAMAVAQFVLNVSEPYASGIGGGAFLLYYDAERGEVIALDGREEAPAAFQPDAFLDERGEPIPFSTRITGGMPVGVPGTLAAVAAMLERSGTISLAEALEPAIDLARRGFVIDAPFARNLAEHADRLARFPASRKLFLHEDGTPLREGETFRNPDLARTFEEIAEEGAGAFYRGPIGEKIVATVRGAAVRPGVMSTDDLARYRAVRRRPVSTGYRGYRVYGMNMPTSGGTSLLMMLNLLEGFDLARFEPGGVAAAHRLAEAQNIVFADRNVWMGDADFVDVPVRALLDKKYAAERRGLIRPRRANPAPLAPGDPRGDAAPPGDPAGRAHAPPAPPAPPARTGPRARSTTHLCIVDEDRNVVSMTTTIEQHFGSGLVVPGRGFLLNNELTDFNARPEDEQGERTANAARGGERPRRTALGEAAKTRGGKRPRSSMAPTIILRDGRPFMAVGSPGGSRIIGIVLNVIVNVLDFGMDVQAAVNAPRIVARNGPIDLEPRLARDPALRGALEARGFRVRKEGPYGAAQAIVITPGGMLHGAADPRREGMALGY